MKPLLVSAFIALFAFPAAAGEMPEVTPAPAANASTVTTTTTAAEAAATVATGEVGKTGEKRSPNRLIPAMAAAVTAVIPQRKRC